MVEYIVKQAYDNKNNQKAPGKRKPPPSQYIKVRPSICPHTKFGENISYRVGVIAI